MKNKIFLVLLSALLPMMVMAQRISNDEAANIASQVLGKQVVKAEVKKPTKTPSVNGEQPVEPFYTIFTGEDGQGFVIVSTDRRAPQIIGYGDGKADPNNLPPQLKAILEKQDSVLQNDNTLPEHSSWRSKAPMRVGEEGGKLLKTANWGQGYPYNLMTPEIDGEHCVTGCVATAMAIIMKFHNWPETGKKKNSYWDTGTNTEDYYDFSNLKMNWGMTQDNYVEGEYSNEEAQEVAKLMFAAGVGAGMNWKPTESGASNTVVMPAMTRFFKYSNEAQELADADASIEEIFSRIKQNIDNGLPVIYYGATSDFLGHAFVVDGYSDNMLVHVNWGWDGMMNGEYNINELPLGNSYISQDYGIIGSLHPAYSEEIWSDCFMGNAKYKFYQFMGSEIPYYPNINISVENVEKDVPFDIASGTLVAPQSFLGKIGLVLTDSEHNIKTVAYQTNISWQNISYSGIGGIVVDLKNCLVKNTDINATDSLYLATFEDEDGVWKLVRKRNELPVCIPAIGNTPDLVDVHWNLSDSELTIDVNKENNYLTEEELNLTHKTGLRGSNLNCVVGASPGDGDLSAIYIDGKLVGMCDDIYSAYCDLRLTNDSYEIKAVVQRMDERITREVTLENPNELKEHLGSESYKYYDLSLAGNIDARDLQYLTENSIFLNRLDLSNCSIVQYGDNQKNSLPEYALHGLYWLTSLTLPKTIEKVGYRACYALNLSSITLPETLKEIGEQAFYCQKILSSVFSKAIVPPAIHENSFCNREQIALFVLPGCKEAYEQAPFWKDFKEIIEDDNPLLESPDIFVNGIKYKLDYNHATIAGWDEEHEEDCPEEVEFESEITYQGKVYPVTTIARQCFEYNSTLKKVIVPESVVNWENYALAACFNLEEVIIKSKITTLPQYALGWAYALKRLTLPETLIRLEEAAIMADEIEYIYLPKNLSYFGEYNLTTNSLKEIDLNPDNPNFVIVDGALYTADKKTLLAYPNGNGKAHVEISEGTEFIRCTFYRNTTANQFSLPNSLRRITNWCFGNYSTDCAFMPYLDWFVLPDNVEYVGEGALPLSPYLTIGKNLTEYNTGIALPTKFMFSSTYKDVSEFNVFLNNQDRVNIDNIFAGTNHPDTQFPKINFYSPSTVENFICTPSNKEYYFYVPGECTNSYQNWMRPMINEMWHYRIYRDDNAILKSASNLNGNLNCSKELEHYAS